MWKQIEAAAREIHDDIEVWFCGHSLGGVVAKLFHHRYRFEGKPFPGLVKVPSECRVVVLCGVCDGLTRRYACCRCSRTARP